MIVLRQFPPALGLPNASPFCLKLETWLNMAGLEFETQAMPDPRKAPLGKLPIVEIDGEVIADSACAIEALEDRFGVNLNAHLNSVERANAHAYIRMLEEHTYWAILWHRWIDDDVWPDTRKTFFAGMPGPVRGMASRAVRKKMRQDLESHGLGRHSAEQIRHRFTLDVNALADNLGDKPYFGGYQPANIDAVAYGFLAQVIQADVVLPGLTSLAQARRNLVEFCDRMYARYFAEVVE